MNKFFTRTLFLFLTAISFTSNAQVFYTETFDGSTCPSTGCDPSLVGWTETILVGEGATPNEFYVSCTEMGQPAGTCGAACGSVTDQSLHIGNQSTSPAAFLACPTGDCGASYDASAGCEANRRAESPTINCTGHSSITISFNYIEGGEGALDDATLWYFDGATWAQINALAKTTTCPSGQGLWTAFSMTLPASADGNPNVKIGFRWVNDGNNNGADPSFAVDDITLSSTSATTPPTAGFTFSPTTICAGDAVAFNSSTSTGAGLSYSWTFTGGTPSTSTAANPSITYMTPGTYNVTLTVTNAGGSDSETQSITIGTCSPPTAAFTYSPASPCVGATVNFTDGSTGGGLTYSWTFAGGIPATSTAPNPSVVFTTAGPHNVTLTVTNSDGTDTETQTVTVVTCGSAPVANYSVSPTPICAGSPATFTNTSTGGPFIAAQWTFVSGTPNSSTSLGTATTTWATPGTYTVQLIIANASGADTITNTVTVVNCTTPPTANFTIPAGPFCQGQCITYTNTSTGSGLTYAWTTPGGTPATSTSASPNICYSTAGTYNVTLIVSNSAGSDTSIQSVTINNCVAPPVANFNLPNDTICRGQCINYTDLSSGTPTSWTWSFAGATPGSSTIQNPTNICYNTIGSFPVTLVVTNSAGTNTLTRTIVVTNCSPPSSAFTLSDNRICMGDCITVNNITTFGTSYLWTFPGGTPDSSTATNPGTICYKDTTGVFPITLIAFNQYGSDTTVQNIIVDTIPIIEAFPDELGLSLGNTAELWATANGPVTWQWISTDTASLGDTTNMSEITVQPTTPTVTMYYVIATGANGCSNIDSVIIDVELTDVIGVPNAFSPNGDGYNDFLKVLGPGIESMHLIIYNRYGQLVFETSDQLNGWDGKQNGKNLDPGVFAYYLEYSLKNGLSGLKKGNITLIR